MAQTFLTNIDLNGNQLQNAKLETFITADLPSGTVARIAYDSTENKMVYYNGTKWVCPDDGCINKSLLTAKGDIIYASAASTPARLAIGSTGKVLKVSSSGIPAWETEYSYTLPLATSSARGGIKIGYSDSTSGTRNYAVQLSSEKAYVTVPWTDTHHTYSFTITDNAGTAGQTFSQSEAKTLKLAAGTGISTTAGTDTITIASTVTIADLMGSTAIGNSTKPVYWNGSAWTACTAYSSASVYSAGRLTTARTIWGQSFNGTADISGDMTSVGKMTFTAQTGSASTEGNVLEVVTIDGTTYLHSVLPFYSNGSVSAGGIGTGGGGGGTSVTRTQDSNGGYYLTFSTPSMNFGDSDYPIAYAKAVMAGAITNAMISDTAAIASTKLAAYNANPTWSSSSTDITTVGAIYDKIVSSFQEQDAMIYKGTLSGTSTSPGSFTPAANKGWTYKVAAAGYIDGIAVEAGDMLICNTDGTAAATSSNYTTIRANWDFIQMNLTSYVTTFGGKSGAITIRSGSTTNGDVNFSMSNNQLQATVYGLGSAAYTDSTTYGASLGAANNALTLKNSAGTVLTTITAANLVTVLNTTAVKRATADASGNTITSTYLTIANAKSTYASTKTYDVASGKTTFTPTTYDFADANIVASLYDASNNVIITDTQIVSTTSGSTTKYSVTLTFASATTAAYRLVVIGKLA